MTDKMQEYIESKISEILTKHHGKASGPCLDEIQRTMPFYGIEILRSLQIIK